MRTFIALAILGIALAATAPAADADATTMAATATEMTAAATEMTVTEATNLAEASEQWGRRRRRRRYQRRRRRTFYNRRRRRRTFYNRRRRRRTFYNRRRRRRTFYNRRRRRRTFYNRRRRRRTFYNRRRRRRTWYNRRRRRRTYYDRRRRTFYCPPRNGSWSGWSNWGSCNASNGYRYRYRSCSGRQCGGANCSGSSSNAQYVRVHCSRHNWGGWSTCTATCGGGVQHRYRGVRTHASCGGNGCPTGSATRSCNTHACPQDCTWTNWGGFNACSKSCGGGSQTRTRQLNQPRYGGKKCPSRTHTRACGTSNCPVHCAVSAFSAWSACTRSCGKGSQKRSRTVTRSARSGGYSCPYLKETRECNDFVCAVDGSVGAWRAWSTCTKSCAGGSMERSRSATPPSAGGKAHAHTAETRACNTHACPINCKTNTWNSWSTCTKSCGSGSQKRNRAQTEPTFGGKACPHYTETRACNKHACAVDCKTNNWNAWSTCTKSCGTGSQKRSRTQTEPTFGGKACPHYTETRACNKHACPIDCKVAAFRAYSTCTKSCGGGSQKRTRPNVEPKYGGKACPHSAETRACNEHNCPVDCEVLQFVAWSTCTKSCGTGSQKRSRPNVEPKYGGKACPHYKETRACNVHPCPIDGGWTSFSSWSTCTKTCDEGNTFRTRTCTNPPAQYGGKDCPAHGREDKPCNVHVCHCPTCAMINGHVQIQHKTEHRLTDVHGPRDVHPSCQLRGPHADIGWCGKSFVIAHRCNYNRDTKKCNCVCRKPHGQEKRDEHALKFDKRDAKLNYGKVEHHHPGKAWVNPAITVTKTGHNPTYSVSKKTKK